MSNAGDWYRRPAGPCLTLSLEEEWSLLATEMLSRK